MTPRERASAAMLAAIRSVTGGPVPRTKVLEVGVATGCVKNTAEAALGELLATYAGSIEVIDLGGRGKPKGYQWKGELLTQPFDPSESPSDLTHSGMTQPFDPIQHLTQGDSTQPFDPTPQGLAQPLGPVIQPNDLTQSEVDAVWAEVIAASRGDVESQILRVDIGESEECMGYGVTVGRSDLTRKLEELAGRLRRPVSVRVFAYGVNGPPLFAAYQSGRGGQVAA